MSFVPLWKWAKSFDLTTGGVLFRAAEMLGSTRFVPLGLCSTRIFLAALVAGGAFIELETCLPEPALNGGFGCRVGVLCVNRYIVWFHLRY